MWAAITNALVDGHSRITAIKRYLSSRKPPSSIGLLDHHKRDQGSGEHFSQSNLRVSPSRVVASSLLSISCCPPTASTKGHCQRSRGTALALRAPPISRKAVSPPGDGYRLMFSTYGHSAQVASAACACCSKLLAAPAHANTRCVQAVRASAF